MPFLNSAKKVSGNKNNGQKFPEYLNTLLTRGKVAKKTYNKKEFYSQVRTNEDRDTETVKEELQSLRAEVSSFKEFVIAQF